MSHYNNKTTRFTDPGSSKQEGESGESVNNNQTHKPQDLPNSGGGNEDSLDDNHKKSHNTTPSFFCLRRDEETEARYQNDKKLVDYCPFCRLDRSKNKIKQVYQNFLLIENKYPYMNTLRHDLIIPKQHFVSVQELSREYWLEIYDILEQKEFEECTILFRNSKSKDKSVAHFHIHVIIFGTKSNN